MKKFCTEELFPFVRRYNKLLKVMKLSTLLLFAVILNLSASVYSQSGQMDLYAQDKTMREVLRLIENQTDYRFFYNDQLSDLNSLVTVNAKNKSVKEILDKMLGGHTLTYMLLDNNMIVIAPGDMAQQQKLTGTVTDAKTGEPLPGVNITIEGTTMGTITDVDGNFSIDIQNNNAVLVFSYVGYISQKITPAGNTTLNVALEADIKALEEVIVVGYGTVRKKDLTTSVSSVTSKDFTGRPITQLAQAMSGQAAGVQVTENSGKPGADISIRVRGATSINANNEPLFVIDGMPTNSSQGLTAEDIESIQILKDASAAAIYGSRGANGVVLITTKRGKSGKSTVSFSSYFGYSQLPKKLDVLNAQQYAELINEGQINAGGSAKYANPAAEKDLTDWQDEVYRNAPIANYQLSFNGGSEKTKYYISLGMLDQKGIIDPTQFKRYYTRLNLDQQINNWLKVGTSVNYSLTDSRDVTDNASVARGGVVLGALSTPPNIPVYAADGTFSVNPFQAWENPVASMKGTDQKAKTNKFMGNVFAELNLTKDLVFKTTGGLETNTYSNGSFVDPYRTGSGRAYKGIGTNSTNIDYTWLFDNTLTYSKAFGDHRFSVMGGISTQHYDWNGTYQEVRNFASAEIPTLNGGTVSVTNSSDAAEWSLASMIGRVTYDYESKYLVTMNIRRDGSSRFGKENRWGTFPSVSVGWRVSQEPFMEGLRNVVNDMKLRVSWGSNGNQPNDAYAAFGKVVPSGGYPFGDNILPGVRQERASNDSLKWESTNQLNFGADIDLFNSRVQVIADVYYKETEDLLMSVSVPTQLGQASQLRNVGNVKNNGFELGVNTWNLTGDFEWRTGINFSVNKNEVKNLGGPNVILFSGNIYERGDVAIVKEGYPIGSFYGLVAKGVDPQTGMMIYENKDDDPAINDKDRVIIGNAQPDFTFGFSNSFSYKNFDLNILFTGVQGNDIFNATRIESEGMENWKNQSTAVLNRWKKPGDVTDIPKALADNKQNSLLSTRFIEDGSYIRLKSVNLSYTFRGEWLKKIHMGNLQLYVTGQNLLTITDYSGYDPEVNLGGTNSDALVKNTVLGIDYGTYPQPRTFIFGIRADF